MNSNNTKSLNYNDIEKTFEIFDKELEESKKSAKNNKKSNQQKMSRFMNFIKQSGCKVKEDDNNE